MAGTATLRNWWVDDRCQSARMTGVTVLGHGIQVNAGAVDAYRALDQALTVSRYAPAASLGGYNCRPIAGKRAWSLHAYGIAVDIDPQLNPQVGGLFSWQKTAFTHTDIEAVEQIKTVDGVKVWTWGGWWALTHDYMHFQLNVPPDFVIDWTSVPRLEEDDMWLKPGDDVDTADDGRAALHYMGGFDTAGVPVGMLQPLGRIADTLMLHDARLRGGGALPEHTHQPGAVQR